MLFIFLFWCSDKLSESEWMIRWRETHGFLAKVRFTVANALLHDFPVRGFIGGNFRHGEPPLG